MTALICLTYDDALPIHREVVAPLLAERGLRGTFYIPAARDDLHVNLDGWRKVAQLGHELGNHSCFHPCRTRADWDWKPRSFIDDIRDLFTVVRSGQSEEPLDGQMSYIVPSIPGDFRRAEDIIAVAEKMRDRTDSWLSVGMHGVGAGTHNNFMNADEHQRLTE